MPDLQIRAIDAYVYRLSTDQGVTFLLLRRTSTLMYGGQWRMVGGKIEAGEIAWQAAQREIREEIAVTPTQMWEIPSMNCFYEWQHDRINLIPAFAAQIEGDPVLNYEHDTFRWCSLDEALSLVKWPEQQRLLKLVDTMLQQGVPEELMLPVGQPDRND